MSLSNITSEGIEVKVGQHWRSLDVRENENNGNARICKVVCVDNGHAIMQNLAKMHLRPTRVSISRMRKGSTGWALIG
jgi:hypothetical protein